MMTTQLSNSIKVVSAGERDPDAEGVSGMSASKMRDAASKDDLSTFKKGLPTGYRNAKDLFKDDNVDPKTINNNLFVGNTSELTKLLGGTARDVPSGKKKL